ncbi:MAG: NYN domain-containing protein [Synechococcales cyanobacterium]
MKTPLLLVDGYNMIGSWAELQQVQRQASIELARLQLVETLSSFVAYERYETVVVFDAYAQATPAHTESTSAGIVVCFTGAGETADSWIERHCALHRGSRRRLRVATSDRLQQLVVSGYGAEWLSAPQLLTEVKRVNRQIRDLQAQRARQGYKPSLERFMDEATRARLQAWRINGVDPAQP